MDGNLTAAFPHGFVAAPLADAHEDPAYAFRRALEADGLLPGDHLIAGRLVRIATRDDRRGKKSGWYVFHQDGVCAGAYGDWRGGWEHTWVAAAHRELSPAEIDAQRIAVAQAQKLRREATQALHDRAARWADEIFSAAPLAAPDHPYLKAKGVRSHGLRVRRDELLIPLYSQDGEMRSLQRIFPDGSKRFLPGGEKKGCYFMIGTPGTHILIAEGYATAATLHEATGLPVVVAFDAGNLKPVAEIVRARYLTAMLTICGDEDQWTEGNPGRRAAEAAAVTVGARALFPQFQDLAERPKDFNDLARIEGLPAVLAQISGAPVSPLQFLQVADFAIGEPTAWFIKRVFPKAALGMVFGESGSGKSFAMLDMAVAIARGEAWRDHKTNSARVGYIAAESAGGMRKRIQAYAQYHQIEMGGLPLYVMGEAPNLATDESVAWIIQAAEACGGLDLMIIDTLAAVTPGVNENSSEDMGAVVWRCQKIHEATGAMVVLVHHSGKDASRGARGWSGLRGAMDMELEVSRDGDLRQIRVSKLKDDVTEGEFLFRLQTLCVGFDEDAEEITSCVALPTDAPAKKPPGRPKSSGMADLALTALKEALEAHGEVAAGSSTIPRGKKIVGIDRWRAQFRVRYGSGEDVKDGAVRIAFMRAKDALLAQNIIAISDPMVWIS